VAAGINAKLLRRHPHVFSGQTIDASGEELARQWERIKREEQSATSQSATHPLGRLPGSLPALQRAQKLVARARQAGVEVNRLHGPVAAVEKITEGELGIALLALVHRAEISGLDAEQALRKVVREIMAHHGNNHASLQEQKD
jgi:XTP/dITP diphosphohydrolase